MDGYDVVVFDDVRLGLDRTIMHGPGASENKTTVQLKSPPIGLFRRFCKLTTVNRKLEILEISVMM